MTVKSIIHRAKHIGLHSVPVLCMHKFSILNGR